MNKKDKKTLRLLILFLIFGVVSIGTIFFIKNRQENFDDLETPAKFSAKIETTKRIKDEVKELVQKSGWLEHYDEETGLSVAVPTRLKFAPDKFAVDNSIDFYGSSKPDSIHISHGSFSGSLTNLVEILKTGNQNVVTNFYADYSSGEELKNTQVPMTRFKANDGYTAFVFVHNKQGFLLYTGITDSLEVQKIVESISFAN